MDPSTTQTTQPLQKQISKKFTFFIALFTIICLMMFLVFNYKPPRKDRYLTGNNQYLTNGYYRVSEDGLSLDFVGIVKNVTRNNSNQIIVQIETQRLNKYLTANFMAIDLNNNVSSFAYAETNPGDINFTYNSISDPDTIYSLLKKNIGKTVVFDTVTGAASDQLSFRDIKTFLLCNDKFVEALKKNTLKKNNLSNLNCVGYISQMKAYK